MVLLLGYRRAVWSSALGIGRVFRSQLMWLPSLWGTSVSSPFFTE